MAGLDITYTFTKKRKDFGKQPMFCETLPQMLDSIQSNTGEQRNYALRNPVNAASQVSLPQSVNEINTTTVVMQDSGVNHAEGGWPKDINLSDEEAVARFRRRVERDDSYVEAVLNTYSQFDHYIKQNNAISMYEMYFRGMPAEKPIEKSSAVFKNVFKESDLRPVSCIGWTNEEDPKLVVSYCKKSFPIYGPVNFVPSDLACYVWNIEYPIAPVDTFEPPTPCWQIACSPISPSVIIGGLEDGRVCTFDIRAKKEAVNISPTYLAHRDPITSIMYMQTRTNTEFFSGATDGQCMWWDIRHMSLPTDTLIMSVNVPHGETASCHNAEGVTALQFDKAFPTRFLCGTDTGLVVNVNRKGKTPSEVMSSKFRAHSGHVKAVHRSPLTSKMFISCGDWTVHIWSDDVITSPIMSGTPKRHQITDVVWAPQRISGYMCISADGKFSYFDLLRKYRDPVISVPVSKYPLLKLKPHEEGRLVAVGDKVGSVYLLSLSDSLVISGDKDKLMMMHTYERETRRKHILENRIKEIRVKQRTEAEEDVGTQLPEYDEEANVRSADEEYFKTVQSEMRNLGGTTVSGDGRMRKR